MCRRKHFSSDRLGHTCLTLFFPITNGFIIIHPLHFHQIGDFSLTITRAVGPRRLTPETALALLSNNSWPLSLPHSYPLGPELLLRYSAVPAKSLNTICHNSPRCSCFSAVYILTTSPSRVLRLQDPSQIHYSFSEHDQIPGWITLTRVHTDLGLRR